MHCIQFRTPDHIENATPADWTNLDDAPELTDALFEHADTLDGEHLVQRNWLRSGVRKVQLTVRYDAKVVEPSAPQAKADRGA